VRLRFDLLSVGFGMRRRPGSPTTDYDADLRATIPVGGILVDNTTTTTQRAPSHDDYRSVEQQKLIPRDDNCMATVRVEVENIGAAWERH